MKGVVVFLILISLLFSGCVGDEEKAVPEVTPTETVTETPTEIETPTEMQIPTEEPTPTPEPKTWMIRLEHFLVVPSALEVNKGDTVVWMNFQDNPKRLFTLVSKDGLWEDTNIGYRLTFKYTFNETGTYNYTVPGWEPRMTGSVIVK